MPAVTEASLLKFSAFISVLQGLGLLLTAWRIYFRFKIRRFSWEDAFAVVVLLTGITWFVMHVISMVKSVFSSPVASWIIYASAICLTMAARLSTLCCIIRIIHIKTGSARLRSFAYSSVVFFLACWIIFVLQNIAHCGSGTPVIPVPEPPCRLQRVFAAIDLVAECLTVVVLVVFPFYILGRFDPPMRQRRMIVSIVASGVVFVSGRLFYTIALMLDSFVMAVIGFQSQVALSTVACNLPVLVPYTYWFFLSDKVESPSATYDDDFTTPRSYHDPAAERRDDDDDYKDPQHFENLGLAWF